MKSLSKYIAVILVLVGILYVTNNDSLSKFEGKEVIDAIENKEVVKYAYKGAQLPVKLSEKEVPELRTDSSYSELVSFNDDGTVTVRTRTYSGVSFYKEGDTWHEVEYEVVAKNDFKLDVPIARLISGKVYATTVFSGAGDGNVLSASAGGWDTAHDDTTGDSFDYTSSTLIFGSSDSFGEAEIARVFLPFDTSSIPSNATIDSATLNVKPDSKTNTDNDGDDWVNVVQTSQASETTLSTADFDQAGAINNPTEGATRIDFGSITTSAYNTWTLDSTGRGFIKKSGETANCGSTAGWTCLGLREGHDAIDSALQTNTANTMIVFMSEFFGTGSDPYLDITYSIPSSTFSSLVIGDKKLEIGNGKLQIGS